MPTTSYLLTVDFEATGYEDPALHSQFVRTGYDLLRWLEQAGGLATFFCVGDVLERFPSLIQAIHQAGHEIACHGWRHTPLDRLSATELGRGLDSFAALAEQLRVGPIRGYRAPYFSLVPETNWALEVLAQRGFVYDSSILPAATLIYGDPASSAYPHRLSNGLIEVPITVWQPLKPLGVSLGIPPFGGTYLRLLPQPLLKRLASKDLCIGNGGVAPMMSYCHPYDMDPSLKRIRGFARQPLHNILLGLGRGTTRAKLRSIARSRESQTVHGWIEANKEHIR